MGSSLGKVAHRWVEIITATVALLIRMVWQPALSSRLLPAECWQCQGLQFKIRSDKHSELIVRSLSPASTCTHPCYTRRLQLMAHVVLGSHNTKLSPLQTKLLWAHRDRTCRKKSQKIFLKEEFLKEFQKRHVFERKRSIYLLLTLCSVGLTGL